MKTLTLVITLLSGTALAQQTLPFCESNILFYANVGNFLKSEFGQRLKDTKNADTLIFFVSRVDDKSVALKPLAAPIVKQAYNLKKGKNNFVTRKRIHVRLKRKNGDCPKLGLFAVLRKEEKNTGSSLGIVAFDPSVAYIKTIGYGFEASEPKKGPYGGTIQKIGRSNKTINAMTSKTFSSWVDEVMKCFPNKNQIDDGARPAYSMGFFQSPIILKEMQRNLRKCV